jgi:hypothetical protein
MAKFLTTKKASAAIEDIILKADKELVLISPFIKIPDDLLGRLKHKNIKIILVCRGEALETEERNRLSDIEQLELRSLKNLHAKCFYNQESMVIGSLNLYDSSRGDNFEMGVLLTLKEDPDLFAEACNEAKFIVGFAEILTTVGKQNIRATNVDVSDRRKNLKTKEKVQNSPAVGFLKGIGKALGLSEQPGYCIRGGEEIPYNVDRPLCYEHFDVWKEHGDPDYKEHYCHSCGKRCSTSFRRPLCLSCFKNE